MQTRIRFYEIRKLSEEYMNILHFLILTLRSQLEPSNKTSMIWNVCVFSHKEKAVLRFQASVT